MNKKLKPSILLIFVLIFSSCFVEASKKIIDETISVPAYSYYYWSFSISHDDVTLTIDITSYLIPVDVIVMNEENFNSWEKGYYATVFFNRSRVEDGNYDVKLGSSDRYYIVLVNTNILFSASVDIKVTVTTPTEATTTAIISIIGLGIFVILLIKIISPKKQSKTYYGPQNLNTPVQVQQPILVSGYCKKCGSKLEFDAVFCPNCGNKVEK